ncbi:MAG: hypothetical protein KGL39_04825 [Patescibacteria group bacterium]|nr:hypothetical protein [Patescibacteria group bacterium]
MKLALTKSGWFLAARKAAYEVGVSAHLVVGASTTKLAVEARWRAWKEIYGDGTKYSVASMGKVCGYDHSTILNAKRHGWVSSTRRGNHTANERPRSQIDGRWIPTPAKPDLDLTGAEGGA